MEVLFFLAGMLFASTYSFYVFFFLLLSYFVGAKFSLIYWFLLAVFWFHIHQYYSADKNMPNSMVISHVTVDGTIDSIPIIADKTQFQLLLQHVNHKPVYARVLVNCYDNCPVFHANEHWQFMLKLKRPQNMGNPGHFNFKENLMARHIYWTAYIQKSPINQLISIHPNRKWWHWRENLVDGIESKKIDEQAAGIIEALSLGITTHINKSEWDLFRRTGTTHLMVISGAHIGLIAGLIFNITAWIWSRSGRLLLWQPKMRIAGIAGLIAAIIYALLAGFAVPAQRAVIAYCISLLRFFIPMRFNGWQSWRYALLLVLIIEPHAVLLAGFYLSFLAVAILIASNPFYLDHGRFKKMSSLQLACLCGLMPFTLYWFSYGAISGFFANFIAIPFVSYLIVPLSLLGVLLSYTFDSAIFFVPVSYLIKVLLHFLQVMDGLSLINVSIYLPSTASLFALMLAFFILFVIPSKPLKTTAVILLLSAFFPAFPRVKKGEFKVDVLDVGQGLSVVIQTATHTLVFDTGMKFHQGSDMAQMAIIPYLATQGLRHIDAVVISHPDLDHRGGLVSLQQQLPIKNLLVDDPEFYHAGKSCHDYPPWQWDNVSFRFLPVKQTFRDRNNSSCVLQISNGAGKLLLTGDIEMLAEYYLLATYKEQLRSDVIIIAHHGSKTSSTDSFIKQVAPSYGVISAGFDNRYHFPHSNTLNTLSKYRVKVFNTMDCGMVSFNFTRKQSLQEPTCFNTK